MERKGSVRFFMERGSRVRGGQEMIFLAASIVCPFAGATGAVRSGGRQVSRDQSAGGQTDHGNEVAQMNLPLRKQHGLVALMLAAPILWGGCFLAISPRSGPEHVFELQTAPSFLSEEMAVEKARATLVAEGYNLNHWQVTRADQSGSKAPDGTDDRYLVRAQAHYGRVSFTDGKHYRTYDVLLQGSRVACSNFRGL